MDVIILWGDFLIPFFCKCFLLCKQVPLDRNIHPTWGFFHVLFGLNNLALKSVQLRYNYEFHYRLLKVLAFLNHR